MNNSRREALRAAIAKELGSVSGDGALFTEPNASDRSGEVRRASGTGAGLASVFEVLEDFPRIAPREAAVRETVELLLALPAPGAFRRRILPGGFDRRWGFWPALALIKSQTRVMSPGFWLAAALATLVAAATTVNLWSGTQVGAGSVTALALPLAVVSPAAAALSVSYALRSFGRGPWEVELSCPITPAAMAVGRLVIVVAYVTGLALAASAVLWGVAGPSRVPGSLGVLVVTWLAPVLFLAALSFYLSLRISPVFASAAALTLWGVQVVFGPWRPEWSLLTLPGEPVAASSLMMLVLTPILIAASLPAARFAAERCSGRPVG